MNVLFLSIEDLNDFIEPLGGHPQAITPNLTRLARRAAVFEHAYAPAPACAPARAAVLFGQAPWRTGLYVNAHDWPMAHEAGRRLSLVGRMRDAGFATIGAGKVFHWADKGIDPEDWDEYHVTPKESFPPVSAIVRGGDLGRGSDFGPVDVDEALYDERNTDHICAAMTRGAERRFWALGLFRPHLPFIVPRRFFDLYPERVDPPPGLPQGFDPDDEGALKGLPEEAKSFIPRRLGRGLARYQEYNAFLRAYLASVSYADHLLGRVLDRMEDQGLFESTLVILWSDHGWQFGEKLCFKKFTLWERALRVPLMIAGPGVPARRIAAPVSTLDIFPTLMARAGGGAAQPLDGRDLSPLLAGEEGRGAAISVWGHMERDGQPARLAATARTATHRYTRYWNGGEELYDHRADPFERRNLLAGRGRWRARLRARALRPLLPARMAPPVPTP